MLHCWLVTLQKPPAFCASICLGDCETEEGEFEEEEGEY
jgi:hypothetical protein